MQKVIEEEPEDIAALIAALKSNAQHLASPAEGKTPLGLAIELRRSPQYLRAMLDHGVDVNQKDGRGRTALETLLQRDVSFVFIPGIHAKADFRKADRRLLVEMAIQLLSKGARPPALGVDMFSLGIGNEQCARCVAEYRDAVAAAVISRAVRSGKWPRCGAIIASFVYIQGARDLPFRRPWFFENTD
ncbi:MAG: ankyrin repeat domain-containing protein [Proteobacteria bacterium]|nr:ankyrin repeat domain-containing protein [Pseudomonadota bacterium]